MTTKRKVGRPRATAGGLRERKSIPFTPEEWRRVLELAAEAGLPVADYIRARCLRQRISSRA